MNNFNTGNNYPNPLDNFRSHSFHFILSVSSTTESFRKMIGNSDGRSPFIDAVNQVKQLGDEINVDGSSAYLLVDTRRFSQYTITEFETNHIYGTGSKLNPTVPATLSRMKVSDSTGFLFFNMLMDTIRNKMQTTRTSAFFMLTVFFVGHNADGTTETISTCYIPMMLAQLSFEFNTTGSVYDVQFIELEGAPQSGTGGQRLNYLGDVASISTKGFSNNLGGMMDALERLLNVRSLGFYEKYSNSAISSQTGPNKAHIFGKLVQYMITLPKEWRDFKLTTAAKSKNEELQHKAEGTTKVPKTTNSPPVGPAASIKADSLISSISFSNVTSISDAIKLILECSQDLLELASEERRKNGTAIAYKTIVSTTSDENSFLIHFDLMPYYIPKPEESKDKANVSGKTFTIDNGPGSVVKNVIHYDYIFTGKNSHITDLKIEYMPGAEVAIDTNLQLGAARSAEVAQKGGQKKDKVKEESKGADKSKDFSPEIKENDPIFFPMKSKEQIKNQASMKTEYLMLDKSQQILKAKQEYTQTYAFLHFVSSTQLNMSIRGNPNLLRKYADRNQRGGIPPHGKVVTAMDLRNINKNKYSSTEILFDNVVSKGLNSSKEMYYKEYIKPKLDAVKQPNKSTDPLLNNVDVSTLPVFVQLNILAPDANSDGKFSAESPLFTNKFFFNGPYQLLMVNSKFAHGEFSQHMTLIPYNIDGSYSSSGDKNAG